MSRRSRSSLGRGGAEDVQADVRQLPDAVEQNGQSIEQLDERIGELEQQHSQDSASP